MRHSRSRHSVSRRWAGWLGAAAFAAAALAGPSIARADGDDFYLGNGTANTTINNTQVVNSYTELTSDIHPGDTAISVASSTGFAAGNLVLVIETTGLASATSGSQTVIDLSSSQVATWELARLTAATGTNGGTLTASAPFIAAHSATVTQVIRVAEYNNLTVTGTINAQAWNGTTGGVIAIFAKGTLAVSGSIDASGAGFRGGTLVNSDTDHLGCTELDLPATPQFPVTAWAQKGEGVVESEYGASFVARGDVANGGGGGDCDNSGGGGGGNGGVGGNGGNSYTGDGDRPVGGLGGAPLSYSMIDHMTLGGGGGSGQENNNDGSGGAAGGGLIFIRANAITTLGGNITSNGADGPNSNDDGAGGGGAGGTIYLRSAGSVTCLGSSFSVTGGDGGKVTNAVSHGPGGGGGGGRMLFQGNTVGNCPMTTNSGAAGTTTADGTHGATPANDQANGILTTLAGVFTQPATPTLVNPADGSTTMSTTPAFTGTATPNTEVIIYVDGLPIGMTNSDGNGQFTFTPTTPLTAGAHTAQAATQVLGEQSVKTTPNSFTIHSAPPPNAPTVILPANDSLTNNRTPTVTGTGVPGDMIKVFIDSTLVGTVLVSGDGSWSYTLTSPQALGDGIHLANAEDVGTGGTSALSNTNQFTVDATPPNAPVVVKPADGSTVATPTPVISGTAEPVSTVSVFVDGHLVGTVMASDTGLWSYPLTAGQALANGMHTASAQATDAAGNESVLSAVNTFTVNATTLPTPTVEKPANSTSINDPTPTYSGTAQAGDMVTIFVDGTAIATVTAAADGTWTYTPTAAQSLADGVHMVNVMASNGMGGISMQSNTNSFTVDTMPPDTMIVSGPPLTDAPPSGQFIFTSTESPVTYLCSVDGGQFVLCSDPTTVGPLGAGQHTFEVAAVDRAGNVDPTPATYTWVVGGDVDASVPDVRIVPDATPVPDAPVLPDASVPDVRVVPDALIIDAPLPADARPGDARTFDAQSFDAASGDARVADAHLADTGGTHDGGGTGDGGNHDAGAKDGGAGDAGSKDAGPLSSYAFQGGGCTCSLSTHEDAQHGGVAWGGLFALGLAGVVLRRKRR